MAKTFYKKCSELRGACLAVLAGVKDTIILGESDTVEIEWLDCDGNNLIETAYAIDKYGVYAADVPEYPENPRTGEFLEGVCDSVCFDELSFESLCRVADAVNKLSKA